MSKVLNRFVAIEGLDGAGTTTQTRAVGEALGEHERVFITCEPTDGEIGRLIRRILHNEIPATPQTVAHLYAADRTEHLYQGADSVTAHLESGELVLTDRYLFSSLAYQSVGCGFDFVYRLNEPFPLPGRLFYIDIDPDLGDRRLSGRLVRDMYERLSFQKQVKEQYERTLDYFSGSGVHIHRLDGSLSAEELTAEILAVMRTSGEADR